MNERAYLHTLAIRLCLPALENAIDRFYKNGPYLQTDHVGFLLTQTEELFRPLWGLAPLLEERLFITVNGEKTDAAEAVRAVMLSATDENDPRCISRFAYQHPVNFANQVITEIAAYAVALSFAREALWDPYTPDEKAQIYGWIKKQAVTALLHSWRNNHFWFPILTLTALEKLGVDCGEMRDEVKKGLEFLDTLYLGDGWYRDGAFGRFDYYVAWSHHVYPLLWTRFSSGTCFEDAARAEEYRRRTEAFVPLYLHFFDSDGSVPPFGRSLSYRFAQSAVFAAAALADCRIDCGAARRALTANVKYFDKNMILNNGRLEPGYLYPSPALAENYTSSGGPLWCAKTFLALALPEDHPFWTAPEVKLPIERGDYRVSAGPENVRLVLTGTARGGVTLLNNSSHAFPGVFDQPFNDMASFYSKFAYHSRAGFGISTPDIVSSDNMISLLTPDRTLVSHRRGFTDMGEKSGWLVSRHTPFANDPDTVILTKMLPLDGFCHIRAHRVTLARPYAVLEGGFSVGIRDDGYLAGDGFVSWKEQTSRMETAASVPFAYETRRHAPMRHLLAPQSLFPSYHTAVLPAGTYYFASCFRFAGEDKTMPKITLSGAHVTVRYGEKTWETELS